MKKCPYKIGTEHPVWWDTHDGRPTGQHQARILDIRPYKGQYKEWFSYILKLSAPNVGCGWLEMTVE